MAILVARRLKPRAIARSKLRGAASCAAQPRRPKAQATARGRIALWHIDGQKPGFLHGQSGSRDLGSASCTSKRCETRVKTGFLNLRGPRRRCAIHKTPMALFPII